ncbi:MAG TPA: hypothetical protein VFK38_08935 [Candidatus Limnocylindrales bacterium]|nr:hypothetical protein [Candidatus Limnocylindrales bacterium]
MTTTFDSRAERGLGSVTTQAPEALLHLLESSLARTAPSRTAPRGARVDRTAAVRAIEPSLHAGEELLAALDVTAAGPATLAITSERVVLFELGLRRSPEARVTLTLPCHISVVEDGRLAIAGPLEERLGGSVHLSIGDGRREIHCRLTADRARTAFELVRTGRRIGRRSGRLVARGIPADAPVDLARRAPATLPLASDAMSSPRRPEPAAVERLVASVRRLRPSARRPAFLPVER